MAELSNQHLYVVQIYVASSFGGLMKTWLRSIKRHIISVASAKKERSHGSEVSRASLIRSPLARAWLPSDTPTAES
ncbi:MAG: hypothetical protein JWM21_2189 [Acidobacteria bacterium]|nr:hypothetical protein [Acidobacteriota bacterium]